ncbi:hypothetical protein [Vibrio alginolyticus]|nr:hypothetical protein [Vibrio alginolyticus]
MEEKSEKDQLIGWILLTEGASVSMLTLNAFEIATGEEPQINGV